jgi:HD-GYP domain-containing protein (c-di-GMP phosphodiesterase class II)
MIQKIKNNPLYNFIFRILLIFFASALVWVLLINSYYEDQLASSLKKEISSHKDKIITLFNKDKEGFRDEVEHLDDKELIEYLVFYDKNKKKIAHYERANHLKKLKSFINEFSDLSFDDYDELIPRVKDDKAYLYSQSSVRIDDKIVYYKLVVQVDKKTHDRIQEDIKETLIVVIITTIIIFISIFPLIYSQYKSMLEKQKELIQSNINTLISLGNAIAKRDSDTNEHNYRVTYYSLKIAQKMQLDKQTIQAIIKGAFLHDIGKIAISDNVLLKPGKLNDSEFEIMKTHVLSGLDIVKNDPWLSDAQKVIVHHHEKIDGTGYPYGLKGEDIPLEARIFSVADVFDALTSKRPYKEAFSVEKSMDILHKDSGTHFDAQVVKNFDDIHKEVYEHMSNINSDELEKIFHESLKPYFF